MTYTGPTAHVTFCAPIVLTMTVTVQAAYYVSVASTNPESLTLCLLPAILAGNEIWVGVTFQIIAACLTAMKISGGVQ